MLGLSGSLFGRRRRSKDGTVGLESGGGGKDGEVVSVQGHLSARGAQGEEDNDKVVLAKSPRSDMGHQQDAVEEQEEQQEPPKPPTPSSHTLMFAPPPLPPPLRTVTPPPLPHLAARRTGPTATATSTSSTTSASTSTSTSSSVVSQGSGSVSPTGATGASLPPQHTLVSVSGPTTATVPPPPPPPLTPTLTDPSKPLPPGGKRRSNKSRRKVEGAPKLEDGWRLLEDPDAFPDPEHIIFSTILEAFSCRICNQVMSEPVAIIGVGHGCGHQACEGCVKTLLASGQSHCTVCNCEIVGYLPLPDLRFYTREAITTRCPCGTCKTIATVEAMSRHIQNECKYARWVCCLSDEEGGVCGAEVVRGDWAKHRHDCPYAPIMCLYEGCPESRLRKDAWSFGRHFPTCPYRTCTCVCGETYMFRDQEKHRSKDCNLQEVSCMYCGQRMHRHKLHAHQTDPKLAHVHLRALVDRVHNMEAENGVLVTHANYVAKQIQDDDEDDYGGMAQLEVDDKGGVSVKQGGL